MLMRLDLHSIVTPATAEEFLERICSGLAIGGGAEEIPADNLVLTSLFGEANIGFHALLIY